MKAYYEHFLKLFIVIYLILKYTREQMFIHTKNEFKNEEEKRDLARRDLNPGLPRDSSK